MTIVYEVNLVVDKEAYDAFVPWLEEHAAELAALPHFDSAEVFADTADAPDGDTRRRLVAQYRTTERARLDAYFAQDAERLRADGMAKFGGRFTASRRILETPPQTGSEK
jgi:putative heme iron utilization protein